MHERLDGQAPVEQSTDRAFGLVMAGACAVLGTVAWWKNPHGEAIFWLAGVGAAFLLLALFWSTPLKPLNKLWLKFGELLHKIISPIVMGAMYFLIITPIGILVRLFGKDVLRMKMDPRASSYWIDVTDESQSSSMKQLF